MPRSQASPSSHRKAPLPQTLKKYVSGAPSPVPRVGRVVSGWQGVGSIFWMVLEGGCTQGSSLWSSLPPVIGVTLSAFHFQDNKKKKVPSDLAKVNVVRVAREGCEHREGGGLEIGAS